MARPLRTAVAWNCKVGRGRAAIRGLRDLIRDTDADAVLLQEAKNYVPAIRLRFGLKWRVYGGPGWVEASNCAVMVRRSVRRGRRSKVVNKTPWYFRNGGRWVQHPGRVWRGPRADGVRLLSVHKATNVLDRDGRNFDVGREEADNLADWFRRSGDPSIAAGDFNNQARDPRQGAPSDIAKRVRGEVVASSQYDIDLAIVRGLDVTVKRLGKYGSDHEAHVYRLRRP